MDAASQVLQESGFIGIETSDNGAPPDGKAEIIAMVGLVGGLKGHFATVFDAGKGERFVNAITEKLGMNPDKEGGQSYRKAVIGEIANQLAGRAAVTMESQGVDINITPPTVISGLNIDAILPEDDDRGFFRVHGEFGDFHCFLALKSTKIL